MFEPTGGLKFPRSKAKILIIIGGAIVVIAAAIIGYFVWQANFGESEAKREAKRITSKIGVIYLIPEEQPTVAKIEDKEKLKDQPFFEKSEEGDYLIVFPEAKMAMVYRESMNKLVNVGPVSFNETQGKQPSSSQPKVEAPTTP